MCRHHKHSLRRPCLILSLSSSLFMSCLLPSVPGDDTDDTTPTSTGLRKTLALIPSTPNPDLEVKVCYLCRLSENTQSAQCIIPVVNKSSSDRAMISVNAVNFRNAGGTPIAYGTIMQAMVVGAWRKHYDEPNNWVALAYIPPAETGYVLMQAPVPYDSAFSVTAVSVSCDTSGIGLAPFASNIVYTGYSVSGTTLEATIMNTGTAVGYAASSWALLRDAAGLPCAYVLIDPSSSMTDYRLLDTLAPGASGSLYSLGMNYEGQYSDVTGFIYYTDHYGNY